MKNFVKLLGITALVTVIGFAMIACEEEAEGDIGPYVGTWIGTLIKGATEYDDAKLVFTETTWTLESTKAGINDNGTYTVNSLRRAILKDSDGYTEFTASVLMSALSLNSDIEGSYSGFSGNFTKEGSNNFSGKWNGSITLGEETYDSCN